MTSMTRALSVLCVLLGISLSAAAAPRGKASPPSNTGRSLVVLVDDVAFSDAAPAVAAALKKEVDTSANYAWKDPPPISVDELLIALSCKKPDLPCIQKMGPMLKTDAVLFVTAAS